jgi:hypothetical protein
VSGIGATLWPVRHLMLTALLAIGCQDYAVNKLSFVETFSQPEREEGIDVLWVIDDSATMYEEQDMLIGSADSFIGFVANAGVDYRLAIVTTDMDLAPGALRGEAMTPDTPDLVDTFNSQVSSSTAGSRDERGFDSAILAADPDKADGFARDGADLELVIFSDEDDHSSMEAADFVSTLRDQRSGDVKVHAVVGDPPAGCVSALAAADAGTKYLTAQKKTGGRRESICTEDYGDMLARVALDVVGLDTIFALSKVPEVKSIEVWVDGVVIPERTPDGWSYYAGDNTLRFDGYAVPRPGSLIEVTYTEWFGPLQEDTGL